MWILLLEACVALFLLVFIVWWTMYAGRKPAPPARRDPPAAPDKDAASGGPAPGA
jgi:hypothetical protein